MGKQQDLWHGGDIQQQHTAELLAPSSVVAVVLLLGVAPGVALDGARRVEGDVGRLEDVVGPEDVQHHQRRQQGPENVVGGEILCDSERG